MLHKAQLVHNSSNSPLGQHVSRAELVANIVSQRVYWSEPGGPCKDFGHSCCTVRRRWVKVQFVWIKS